MAKSNEAQAAGLRGGYERPRLIPGGHQHPERVEINYFLDGDIVYLVRGSMVRIPPRRLTVFWGSVPHQGVKVHASRFYWFTVPLTWVMQWKLPALFLEKMMAGALLVDQPVADDEQTCARWVRDLHAEAGVPEAAELELQARLLRLAQRLTTATKDTMVAQTAEPAGSHLRVERMARFISEHFREEISAADIARAASLNVNYASTLFHQQCGVSPTDYLLLHRAHHAHLLLATTDQKIVSIAFDSGFRSLSRFYATFDRIFHCPPRDIRQRKR